MAKEKLFTDFKGISKDEWKKKIETDLKGKPYSELCSTSSSGIKIEPVYTYEDLSNLQDESPGSGSYRRSSKTNSNDWVIDEVFYLKSNSEGNQKSIQKLLNFGLTGITLSGDVQAEDLKGILPQYVTLGFQDYSSLPAVVSAVQNQFGTESNTYSIHLNFDPIGKACLRGTFDKNEINDAIKHLTRVKTYNNLRWFSVNGTQYHNAGANAISELAFTLAHAHEYLVLCLENGMSIDDTSARIKLDVACGADYFQELAKLRALRLLWSKLIGCYTPTHECSKTALVQAHSSQFYSTVYDPYVNMLRGTTQGMSAALGGADIIRILPFNTAWKKGSDFAKRIARNIQLLLKEESYFDKVIDPAGGSYYLEYLTEQLAQKAWEKFQKIEEKGGFIGLMTSGNLARELNEDLAEQLKKLNAGETKVLGVTLYPNPQDKMLNELDEWKNENSENNFDFASIKLVRLTGEIEMQRMQEELNQNSTVEEDKA